MTAPRLGIVGDGQLARMTVLAAVPLGVRCTVVGSPHSPAGQVAPVVPTVDLLDVDVITFESEFVPADSVRHLRTPLRPSAATLATVQDKATQKRALLLAGVPVPPFAVVGSADEALDCGFDLPMVVKARFGGYDGLGTATCRSTAEVAAAVEAFDRGDGVLVEAFVPFTRELSVLVARSVGGDEAVYPVLETVQRHHQCAEVLLPAPGHHGDALDVAVAAVRAVDGCGITAVELFQLPDGDCIVNELAPRPHNSGHVTIEACVTSQFAQHVRAVLGWPLGPTTAVSPGVMANVIGHTARDAAHDVAAALAQVPDAHVHLYGKLQERPRRKMGHVTVLHRDIHEAARRAVQAARLLEGADDDG